jgi:hypothetical protein
MFGPQAAPADDGRHPRLLLLAIGRVVDGGPSPAMTGHGGAKVNHSDAWYKTSPGQYR